MHGCRFDQVHYKLPVYMELLPVFQKLVCELLYDKAGPADMSSRAVIPAFHHACHPGNDGILNHTDMLRLFLHLFLKLLIKPVHKLHILFLPGHIP